MDASTPTTPRWAAAGTQGPGIRFAIATDGPVHVWQADAVEALAAVPGVSIVRWDRHPPPRSRPITDGVTGARRVADVPASLAGLPAIGTVDVVLDLTATGLPAHAPDTLETWRFGYGPARSRDVERTALFEYITTPSQARVALISEPRGAILRDGLLTCRREERVDRVLLDTAGWPASVASARLRADGVAIRTSTTVGRSDPAATIPMPVLRLAAAGRRGLRMRSALTRHDDWNIGLIDAPIAEVVASGGEHPIDWFPLRPGRFAADPFGFERDGDLHVFFEDYDQRAGRGVIAHVGIDAHGRRSEPEVVLDTGLHASYPSLIEDDGAVYMLPELSAANELVLFGTTTFPTGWRPVATLLAGVRAVDATVVRSGDRWWMFATIADLGAGHNLFIWHAPNLFGPWTPHAANPVKTDSRSSRPAGTPYVVDGVLYRPSQDCSVTYGGAVMVNRIDVLTEDTFAETPVRSITPRPDSPHRDGLHTLSAVGQRTLVDSKTLHLVPGVLQRQFGGRIPFARRRLGGGRT